MTTRELLLREIGRAPDEVLEETLRYLQHELTKRGLLQEQTGEVSGPYANYWNQFLGHFMGEEWERPSQGNAEDRAAW